MYDLIVRLLAVLAGCALSVQPPINARLRSAAGDPLWASFISFMVGGAGLAAIAMLSRAPFPSFGGMLRAMPWWGWTGGLCGVIYVLIALIVVPRIGAAALLALVVFGMMVAAMAIDTTGAFGVMVRALSPLRIVGAACVVAGVVLISRF